MSVFISQLLEESLESPSDVSGIHERVLEIVTQMETGEVGELVTVLKKAQEDLNEQMDFSYFKRVKELEAENKRLKEENERLKERQMIQNAIASEHINEINDVHGEYGKKIRKLEEEIKKLKEKS